jgi:hypothetical protein
MKSARLSLWPAKPSANPKAPALSGTVELPAALVWELSQMLQAGQGMQQNQQTGEQFFQLRISVWHGSGEPNASVLNGQIQTPSEQAAYLASKAQQQGVTAPQGQPWGAQQPPAPAPYGQPPQAPPPGYPQQPPAAAPAPWQQAPTAAPGPWQQPPAAMPPAPAPAPAPAPQPPAWGGAGGWGG